MISKGEKDIRERYLLRGRDVFEDYNFQHMIFLSIFAREN